MPCNPFFLRPEGELTVRFCFVDFDGEYALAHAFDSSLSAKSNEEKLRAWKCDKVIDGTKV